MELSKSQGQCDYASMINEVKRLPVLVSPYRGRTELQSCDFYS